MIILDVINLARADGLLLKDTDIRAMLIGKMIRKGERQQAVLGGSMILNGIYVKDELIITTEFMGGEYVKYAKVKRYSDHNTITIDTINCNREQYEIALLHLERNMSK